MGTHAKLSASSAKRWMNCPGSIRMIDDLADEFTARSSNFYADQGTAAHALCERCLVEGRPAEEFKGMLISVHPETGDTVFYPPAFEGENLFEVDVDMIEAVQVYLDVVAAERERLPDANECLEERLDLTWLRDNMYGTADYTRHQFFSELVVIDYKHGAGVVVEVEWNEQMMYYALGALQNAGGPGDVSEVTLIIVQPRAPHRGGPVRRWTISAEALWEWKDQLASAADATQDPDAPLVAGEWCRFCPASALCPAVTDLVAQQAQQAFADKPLDPKDRMPELPNQSEPFKVSQALNALPIIDAWCRAVEGLARQMLEHGMIVPDYKLVRKGTQRRWADEKKTTSALRRITGLKKSEYTKAKLLSPAQMEKLPQVGRKFVEKYAVKPEGGLTVVHVSDKRPAEEAPAKAAFSVITEGDVTSAEEKGTSVDGLDFMS